MSALCPGPNGPAHDLVATPPGLAAAIVSHFGPSGRLLDPARGNGAFFDAMLPFATVLDWYEIAEGRDFLALESNIRYDWAITNPPWSKLRAFLRSAMSIGDNIVYLATITHFVTKARLRDIAEAGFGLREFLLCPVPPRHGQYRDFSSRRSTCSADMTGRFT
jgi:hypothetical protein